MAAFVHRCSTQQKENADRKQVIKVMKSIQILADSNLHTHVIAFSQGAQAKNEHEWINLKVFIF